MKHLRTISRQCVVPAKAQTTTFQIKLEFILETTTLLVTKFPFIPGEA